MLIFILRRLSLFVFTLFLLTVISFSLSYLFPGDAALNLSGQINVSPEQLAFIQQEYRMQSNILMQYFTYLGHLTDGNLGLSMSSQKPIYDEMLRFLPATVELSIIALALAMCIGIPLGFIAAIYHRSFIDKVILSLSMIGYSVPVFWLGLLMILIFSIQLGWLPSAGQLSLIYEIDKVTGILLFDILMSDKAYKWQAFWDATRHMVLPAVVVATAPATIFVRMARSSMLDVLETGYIKAAKAKGLSFIVIIFRHGIRNAMINIIRQIGLQFANLITIAMITEVIFDWPGVGRWLIESIYQRDYTAIQAGLLVLSTFIFVIHIITDIVYASLNPIAREQRYGTR